MSWLGEILRGRGSNVDADRGDEPAQTKNREVYALPFFVIEEIYLIHHKVAGSILPGAPDCMGKTIIESGSDGVVVGNCDTCEVRVATPGQIAS